MNIKTTLTLILAPLVAVLAPQTSSAQFINSIGTASFGGNSYACRTYSSKQDIIITTKAGRSRTVSKSAGKAVVEKSLKRISGRIIDTSDILKQKKARLNKLYKSRIPTPAIVKEIKLTEEQVARLTGVRDRLKAQRAELQVIRTGIKNCGKSQPLGSGGNSVYNMNTILPRTGKQVYAVLAAHVFSLGGYNDPFRRICISKDGAPFEQGVFNNDVCQTFYDGTFFSNPTPLCANVGANKGVIVLGGGAGTFNDGKYDDAVAKANAAIATIVKVKAYPGSGACPQ